MRSYDVTYKYGRNKKATEGIIAPNAKRAGDAIRRLYGDVEIVKVVDNDQVNLKSLRLKNNLSQQQVADAISMSVTNYACLERGERKLEDCKYITVIKLERLLGKEVTAAIIGSINVKPYRTNLNKTLEMCFNVSYEQFHAMAKDDALNWFNAGYNSDDLEFSDIVNEYPDEWFDENIVDYDASHDEAKYGLPSWTIRDLCETVLEYLDKIKD